MRTGEPKVLIRISVASFAIALVAMFLQKNFIEKVMCVGQAWRTAAFGVYGLMHFTNSGFREHSKKFRPEDMQRQIEGKNCVVTGANSGIGYATAEELASRGATVYIICRNRERGEAALSKIQSKTGNQNVCDLSSINDVKSFASKFSLKDQPLHVLFYSGNQPCM
ncbi:hypothetical protein ACLOJK_031789 [Asimina triloba]